MEEMEERPLLEHLPSEFLTWLWFTTEKTGGTLKLDDLGVVDLWVEDRIAFRSLEEDKPHTVLSGENASNTMEARAALAGGRVVRELRLFARREEREYHFTLKGLYLDINAAKLPGLVKGATEEVLYDRMYLYEELNHILSALLRRFARERTSDAWSDEILSDMRSWVTEALRRQEQGEV